MYALKQLKTGKLAFGSEKSSLHCSQDLVGLVCAGRFPGS
jgi:hypothetical protein